MYANLPPIAQVRYSLDSRLLMEYILQFILLDVFYSVLEKFSRRASEAQSSSNSVNSNFIYAFTNPAFLEWFTKLDDNARRQVVQAIAMLSVASNPQTAFLLMNMGNASSNQLADLVKELQFQMESMFKSFMDMQKEYMSQVEKIRELEREFITKMIDRAVSNQNQQNPLDIVSKTIEILEKAGALGGKTGSGVESSGEVVKKIVEASQSISNFYSSLITSISDAYSKALESLKNIRPTVSELKEISTISPETLKSFTDIISSLVKSQSELVKIQTDYQKELEKFRYEMEKDFLQFKDKMLKSRILFKRKLEREKEINRLLDAASKVLEKIDVERIVDRILSSREKRSEKKTLSETSSGEEYVSARGVGKVQCSACGRTFLTKVNEVGEPIVDQLYCPYCGTLVFKRG